MITLTSIIAKFLKHLLYILVLCLFSIAGYAQQYKLKDKVEVKWSGQWYPSEIIEVKGKQYKIHYIGYGSNWDEWVTLDRMRPADPAKVEKATITNKTSEAKVNAPRKGKFSVYSYGGNAATPIYMGYFILTSSGYQYYNAGKRLLGKGSYTFNVAKQQIAWKSGPFKDNSYGGGYEVERQGKTHKIRLLYTMIGTNSTD